MTAAISRWLSAAIINIALVTPALALDDTFGDEPLSTADNQDLVGQQITDNDGNATTNVAATDSATVNDNNGYGQIDDPLTFNTLRRITLKQLRVDANANQPESVKDPLQPLNRKIHLFNTKFDKYLLLPVASRYKKYTPAPIKSGVGNFFSNLGEPWNAVNHLLQGHPKSSYKSLGRFTVNTLTSLGIADPAAKRFGINKDEQDFGLTLGKWGLRSGPFLMLPGLGPSTLRDGVGRVFDMYGRPQHYMHQNSIYWTSTGLNLIDTRAGFVGVENLVQGDQYALLRDLYLQRRQYLVAGDDPSNAIDNSFGDDDADFGNADFDSADFSETESDSSADDVVATNTTMTDDANFGDESKATVTNVSVTDPSATSSETSLEKESDAAIEQDDVF